MHALDLLDGERLVVVPAGQLGVRGRAGRSAACVQTRGSGVHVARSTLAPRSSRRPRRPSRTDHRGSRLGRYRAVAAARASSGQVGGVVHTSAGPRCSSRRRPPAGRRLRLAALARAARRREARMAHARRDPIWHASPHRHTSRSHAGADTPPRPARPVLRAGRADAIQAAPRAGGGAARRPRRSPFTHVGARRRRSRTPRLRRRTRRRRFPSTQSLLTVAAAARAVQGSRTPRPPPHAPSRILRGPRAARGARRAFPPHAGVVASPARQVFPWQQLGGACHWRRTGRSSGTRWRCKSRSCRSPGIQRPPTRRRRWRRRRRMCPRRSSPRSLRGAALRRHHAAPLTQSWPTAHAWQVAANAPHALAAVPLSQRPFASQHPGQLCGLHAVLRQTPPLSGPPNGAHCSFPPRGARSARLPPCRKRSDRSPRGSRRRRSSRRSCRGRTRTLAHDPPPLRGLPRQLRPFAPAVSRTIARPRRTRCRCVPARTPHCRAAPGALPARADRRDALLESRVANLAEGVQSMQVVPVASAGGSVAWPVWQAPVASQHPPGQLQPARGPDGCTQTFRSPRGRNRRVP